MLEGVQIEDVAKGFSYFFLTIWQGKVRFEENILPQFVILPPLNYETVKSESEFSFLSGSSDK